VQRARRPAGSLEDAADDDGSSDGPVTASSAHEDNVERVKDCEVFALVLHVFAGRFLGAEHGFQELMRQLSDPIPKKRVRVKRVTIFGWCPVCLRREGSSPASPNSRTSTKVENPA
jgi:hypothetical protein